MTLDLYIGRRYLMSLLKVQLVILGLILLFDYVENFSRFRDTASNGDIIGLSLVRVPALVSQMFPLVVLIAGLWTFLGLARSSELVVLRAAGLSGIRLGLLPMLLTLSLGVLAFAVLNPIVAATSQREDLMLEDMGAIQSTRFSINGPNIWLRQSGPNGQTVIEAERAEADGSALHNVRMFEFGADGTIISRTDAPLATLASGKWSLENARRLDLQARPAPIMQDQALLTVSTDLTSDRLLENFAAPEKIPFWELPEFISKIESSGFSGVKHRLFFQTEIARPVVFLAMLLIGMAFSMRPVRFGNTAVMVLAAIVAGFSFYFVLDVAVSFAAARQVPIGVAAWAPPFAAAMLALALLLHFEDG